ncbi:hypothetical protein TVAG_391210 [Trichomonas vaginalis G3]|uniref:Uncharacterized protein n=1 Tax=Trichomonas vaginalis (strain ATCC PRA-98 / G3) TaxID=412133 RepID=A2DFN4_TRIV3|nr:hypothetical protein TVAGG3_0323760 [Trichomonas vaginalis G3]EAY20737.1 hypothetical protein TVAG_391210 [Trichomonas vaginalis G3]KAI5529488.1 hypothetical protein TVAGG3_0323760 [Trichomonas vaginalis G3]|eukprot:XP_001581723.1 hypothetical protein [Trichomonas vaginalis G3]
MRIFSNKKLYRKSISDKDIKVYFSTKASDSIDLFAYYNISSTEYYDYALGRGTNVYHLSPPGKSSKYTYSQSHSVSGDAQLSFWHYEIYWNLWEEEEFINDTEGSIIPLVGYNSEGDDIDMKYSFKVQNEGDSEESDHLFPDNIGLFIPTGINTLEEVKDYSRGFDYEAYQKEFEDLYAFLKKEVNEHPYKEEEEIRYEGWILIAPIALIFAILGLLHIKYWDIHAEDSNLEAILGDVKSDAYELDNMYN